MLREVFYHLPIERISFELESVSKLFQGWVVVVITSRLTDFFSEPLKGLSGLVLEVLINGSYFQTMAEVLLQQGYLQ